MFRDGLLWPLFLIAPDWISTGSPWSVFTTTRSAFVVLESSIVDNPWHQGDHLMEGTALGQKKCFQKLKTMFFSQTYDKKKHERAFRFLPGSEQGKNKMVCL